MVQWADIKKNLYGFSPWLYTTIYRLYWATPYAKFWNARIDRGIGNYSFDKA